MTSFGGDYTQKSALVQRVKVGTANQLLSRRQLRAAEPGCMGDLNADIYSRPAHPLTNLLPLDASAMSQTPYNAAFFVRVVDLQQRNIGAIPPGHCRGPSDFLGLGRDLIPRDLYFDAENGRGNFVQTYPYTMCNTPADVVPDFQVPIDRRFQDVSGGPTTNAVRSVRAGV